MKGPYLCASAMRSRPKPGQLKSGDASLVIDDADGSLVVVVDALGHGNIANEVADRALEAVHGATAGTDVVAILGAMHEALKGTRGAAATVCTIVGGRVRAAGVGNVELRVQGLSLSMALTPGILGSRHGPLHVSEAAPRAGARLLFFSDGVSPNVDLSTTRALDVPRAADALFDRHAMTFDDATLVVVELR